MDEYHASMSIQKTYDIEDGMTSIQLTPAIMDIFAKIFMDGADRLPAAQLRINVKHMDDTHVWLSIELVAVDNHEQVLAELPLPGLIGGSSIVLEGFEKAFVVSFGDS